MRLTLFSLFILVSGWCTSQNNLDTQSLDFSNPENDPDWSILMQDPDVSFEEVQALFQQAWANREITKGCGWKPFKRWEAHIQERLDENGEYLTSQERLRLSNEVQTLMANRSPGGSWQPLGPILDENTTRDNIRGVGRVNTIAFHPTDDQIIFSGMPAGGIWRSYDAGQNWESNSDNLPTPGVSAIAFDPNNPNIVYIGTGDRDAGDAPGMGVMKSTDGGLTWDFVNNGIETRIVGDLIVSSDDSNVILAATSSGIYKSTDAGENWDLVSTNNANYKQIDFKPGDESVVYATAQGRFYKSSNGGDSWTYQNDGIQQGTRMVFAVTPANPEKVYVCSATTYQFKAFFTSEDSGENFIEMSDEPNILGWAADGSSDGGQAWYDFCMTADPVIEDRVYVGGVRMKRSDDAGATWVDIQNGYTHVDHHWLEVSPYNGDVYLANDGGVYHYEDNLEWVDISEGIVNGQMYQIGQSPHTANRTFCGFQDNGTSEFTGTNWQRRGGGDGFECQVDPTTDNWWYTSLYYGQVYRTSGDFQNQKIAGEGELEINESGAWNTPWFISQHDENNMFLGMKNVWRCKNIKHPIKDSIQWEVISSMLGGSDNTNLSGVVQSKIDENVLYATEGTRKFFRSDNCLDDEVEWVDLSNSLPWVSVPVSAIEVHPTDSNVVYIGFDDRFWRSDDQGENWTDMSEGLPSVLINSIEYDHLTGLDEGIYLGTDFGVYYREASFEEWIPFSDGLPLNVPVRELEIFYGDDISTSRLKAGTYGRGLWESDLFDESTYAFPAVASLVNQSGDSEVFGDFDIDVKFYKNLTNVDVTDLEVADFYSENATLNSLSGGPDVYTLNITPSVFGEVKVFVPNDAAIDSDGILTLASDTLSLIFQDVPEPFGIYGPGGLGDQEHIAFWLRADKGTFYDIYGTIPSTADGEIVGSWIDQSGNDLSATQIVSVDRPTIRTGENGINGQPAIEFNGENNYLTAEDIEPGTDMSAFSVVKAPSIEWNTHGWIASSRMDNGFILHPWEESSLFSAVIIDGEGNYAEGSQYWIVDAAQTHMYGVLYSLNPFDQTFYTIYDDQRIPWEGSPILPRTEGALIDVKYGWDYDDRFGEGLISEHFIYNRRLYESHRTLVSNYIGAKYGITMGPVSRYSRYDYPQDLAGIGREHFYDLHEDALGTGSIRINSASDLEDGEYLMWGHQNGANAWTTDSYPITSNRLIREWAYEQTGDVGEVDVIIYEPFLLDIGEPIGLIITDNNEFLPGVTPEFVPLEWIEEESAYGATVDFTNSGVFTIGVNPTVGVEDISKAEMKVYPNPAEDIITISSSVVNMSGVSYQLYDATGRLIESDQNMENVLQLDLNSLSLGLYNLVLMKDDQRRTIPFVKK